MDITVTVPEFIGGGFLLLLLNIAVWAFAWGRSVGRVCETIENLEKRLNGHVTNHESHAVLADCAKTFTEIKERLSGLEAKVDIIVGRE